MTTALVSLTIDAVPPTVCRVEDSFAVHLLAAPARVAPGVRALCGGVVVPGRPERLLVRNPCARCVREAQARGLRTVRDRSSAWVNLSRLAVTLRTAA
jgi:hypothetical protein